MFGPVLAQELLLGSRRSRQQILRRIYAGWLMVQLLFAYWMYLLRSNLLGAKLGPVLFGYGGEINPDAASSFAISFVASLVWQHLILILIATPAFTAGAITDEKSRGTLQYLLAADLAPGEIILGKLFGRVTQVALLSLAPLPVLCFVGVFGGVNLVSLISVFLVMVVPMLTLGAASLLASVWSKQTRDAVIGVYLCGAIVGVLVWAIGWLPFFDPLHVLEPAWGSTPDLGVLTQRLFLSMLAWGSVGLACLALATWRLRAVYLRQLEGEGRTKKRSWWLARRAAIPEEPIRWKERHVEGLAPLASLRRLPRWLGMTAIFVVTLVSSAAILCANVQGAPSFADLLNGVLNLKLAQFAVAPLPAAGDFMWQGIVGLLVATLLVGLRCSGAITGERERQTWEALLLTPLPVRDLIRGKLWGIIGASYPYLLSYAVPAVFCSLFAGFWAFFLTVLLLIVTWLAMAFMGAAGVWCSTWSKTSWRSLLWSMVIGYAGGFFLFGVAFPVAGLLWLIIFLSLTLLDYMNSNQTGFGRLFANSSEYYQIATCVALIGGFWAVATLFLRSAQKYVALRERVRHWKEEPKRPRARKRRIPTVGAAES